MNSKYAKLKSGRVAVSRINFVDHYPMKWLILILFFVNAALYFNTLSFGFTSFDDDAVLQTNEKFLSEFSNVKCAIIRDAEFQKQRIELYRPLQNMSYFFDVALFGFNTKGFHFTNIILHLCNILVLFLLLIQLKFDKTISFFGTLLYSINPMFAFTVAWLPSRGDLLLSLFALLSLLMFFKYIEERKTSQIFLHLVFFALALLAKESALAIIPIALLYAFLVVPNFKLNKLIFASWLVYLLLILAYFYLRKMSIAPNLHSDFGIQSLIYNLRVLPESFLIFVLPINMPLLPFYSLWNTLIGSVLLVGFIMLFFSKNQNIRLSIWALIFVFSLMLPSMFYKPQWSSFIYDYLIHRNYLPFVGFLILLLQLFKAFENKMNRSAVVVSGFAVLLLFGGLNLSFSSSFASPSDFWSKAVNLNPKSAFAQNYYGNTLQSNGDYSNALNAYDASIKLKNNYSDVYLNRGVCLMKLNNQTEAIRSFTSCLTIDPKNLNALKYRASVYLNLKDHLNSRNDLSKLILLEPKNLENFYNRGLGYFLMADYKQAVVDFSVVLGNDSTNIQVIKFLAFSYLQLNNIKAALDVSMRWVALFPDDVEALNNLAYAYWEFDNFPEAQKLFMRVYEKNLLNLDAFLGLILCQSKNNNSQISSLIKRDMKKYGVLTAENKVDALEKAGFAFTNKQKTALQKAL